MKLEILYEDNHVIVAVKPPMLPVQADSSGDIDMLTMLKNYIKEKYEKPGEVYLGLVHRLDRPVGGVMVFARTSKAAARLSEQVRLRQIEKEYAAVIHGTPKKEGILKDYLLRDKATNKTLVVKKGTPEAKEAVLSYRVEESKNGLSLVKIQLETGRHHQIRVQFASRGYALYGDVRYGNPEEKGQIALVSHRLAFIHPTKKEKMAFSIDYKKRLKVPGFF